jgi:hypothetical protein
VKIVDPETGAIVPRGEKGELCTRGYSVMLGYWNDEAATHTAIDAAGWMHTGDLATMDDEGYVNIVGRIKDMIIRGGENIYPREIEEFLYTHPGVQRGPGHRRPQRTVWGRGDGLDHPARRPCPNDGRHPRLLQGAHLVVQDPAVREVRGQLPHDGDGEDPEVPHAGVGGGGAGARGGGANGHGVASVASGDGPRERAVRCSSRSRWCGGSGASVATTPMINPSRSPAVVSA